MAGSVTRGGGRFNIGAGVDSAAFTPFPALYIAEDYATAFRERFGSADEPRSGMTAEEFALRSPGSFTHVALRGQLELVIDIGIAQTLNAFASVLGRFVIPPAVRDLARRLGIRRPMGLVRTVSGLQRQLLHAHWRAEPAQFDLPANSQVFGRIAASAGLQGILEAYLDAYIAAAGVAEDRKGYLFRTSRARSADGSARVATNDGALRQTGR